MTPFLAFAIGDALGVPYEFQERGSFLCTDLTGYGCHHQPEGTWSDDTSMTLATLKSLKENNGKIHIEDIRKRFLSWLHENAFTANGEVFDIGHATYEALTSGKPCVGGALQWKWLPYAYPALGICGMYG